MSLKTFNTHRDYPWLIATVLCVTLLFCSSGAFADPLRMGIFPRRDAATSAKLFHPLVNYLETALGRPVVLKMSPDFDTLLVRLKESSEGRRILEQARLTALNLLEDKNYAIHRATIEAIHAP